ncbi:solute carrier family 22 member 3 [Drosophila ficusphila]|uniref:solute carrier family 22 member 3 n=1 Tax=Drosophila ficusphila TaxID=30025 RepID=UPI0007E659A8|nr:solute carrier family 22 member 3 [Drosophila ficusphila]
MPSADCQKYEDFLPIIGEFGPFQRKLLLGLLLAAFLFAFTYLGQIFMVLVPTHWCRIRELEGLPKEEQLKRGIPTKPDGDYENCVMYNEPLDSNMTNMSNQTRRTVSCNDGWVYDRNEIPYESIATEYNWVCDKQELSTYSVIAYFLGSVVGCLCFGYVADHYGRLVALFLANSCSMIGGCISAVCKDFYCFAASRCIVGLAMNNCFLPIYILTLENVGIKYRTLVGNLGLAVFFTLGTVILPWIAYAFENWRHYALVIALPVVLLILVSLLLPESPSWLLSMGKFERGMLVLKEAAESNGKTISDKEWSKMEKCFELKLENELKLKHHTCLDLFKTCRRSVVMIILIVCWMMVALVYDAHVRVVEFLSTDIFLTFSVSSLVELPAGILPLLLLDRVGRKPIMTVVMFCCAGFSLAAGFLEKNLEVIIMATIARFFVTVAYNVHMQWSSEILPTVVRGQGMATINVLGQISVLMSPVIVYTHHIYEPLPMFIIALLSLIAAIIVVILPETKNTDMPHSMDEAEKRWTLSCRNH